MFGCVTQCDGQSRGPHFSMIHLLIKASSKLSWLSISCDRSRANALASVFNHIWWHYCHTKETLSSLDKRHLSVSLYGLSHALIRFAIFIWSFSTISWQSADKIFFWFKLYFALCRCSAVYILSWCVHRRCTHARVSYTTNRHHHRRWDRKWFTYKRYFK